MAASSASIAQSKSAQIRARLNHPIIDSDGHTIEHAAVLSEYIAELAGPALAERFRALASGPGVRARATSLQEANRFRITRGPWWGIPARNTLDRATAMLPKLLYERLQEMGLDFSVVYTTLGFGLPDIADDEMRRVACRALNRMRSEMFADFSDRLTPAAVIPMHTPQEAISELEYATRELGMKAAIMMASYVRRPVAVLENEHPQAARYAYWLDVFGLDSLHDYDPLWARCQELGIAPTFHSLGYTWGSRQSPSNYVYNHVGNFAASAEAVCKALFLGGVPVRFPKLNFGFLEGGVAWAVLCYCDLVGHWHKRNGRAMRDNLNPALVDEALFADLVRRYARRRTDGDLSLLRIPPVSQPIAEDSGFPLDEFARSGVREAQDIRDIFVNRFYFGCEGDDPLNALAFRASGVPFGARLKALYGSDIGHWDVTDMAQAAEEAYELVEQRLLDERELRAFLFDNAIGFWTWNNPHFFDGTAIESEVARRRAELFRGK
jgi:predicted TIM-barrel fold metal-dependent hydrolase